jgi:hypothetical protein
MHKLLLGGALALAAIVAAPAGAAQHSWKEVSQIQAPPPQAACIYFQLVGVGQADQNVAGPWFAVSSSHAGYKEIYILLLAAKLSGTELHVTTTGQAVGGACGNYAAVESVWIPG